MTHDNLVLVVDDDRDCRDTLVIALQMLGINVISAVDGMEAVELAIACRPTLILMDLNMPNLDGYDASRIIHSHAETREIPIIAVSANGDERQSRQRAFDAGCIQCWTKPFRVDALLDAVGLMSEKKFDRAS